MKKNPVIPLLALAALAATSSYGQGRIVEVDNLAALQARRFLSNETVRVRGYSTPADWGDPRDYYYQSSSPTVTNAVMFPAVGGGRYYHPWNGDVRVFGVLPNDVSRDAINGAAVDAAASYAKTSGEPLKFGGGQYYLDRSINAQDITKISGAGKIGNQYETIIYITRTNTSGITNLSTGGSVENLHIRPLYYSYAKQSTSGYGVHGVSGSSAQTLRNLYIEGFHIGVGLSTFDSLIEEVDVIAARPFLVGGGGTQNTFIRCSARGNIVIAGLTDDTSITCAAYTAGSTNITVSDASTIAIGDYIRVRDSTEYSNTITYRFFPRKIIAISGTSVTINYPWELSFTNGRFEFALGKGFSAFEATTENVMVGCNAEWGAWDHIYTLNSGPTASSTISGFHVEGWTVDPGSGANSYVLNGVNTSISASHVDMANVTVFDTAGFALAEGGTRGFVDVLHVRDFDQHQAIPFFYAGAWNLTRTYSGSFVVGDINNAGADVLQRTVDGTQWRNTVADFKFGEGGELVRVDGFGVGQATWFGYSDTPTGGNFVQGDRIVTANEVIRVLSTGSFQTAAGSNRMFNGSSVLLVDQAARGVLGRRTPVAFAVTNGTNIATSHLIVREQLRNSPDTNALTAAVPIGARMIQVSDASGVQQGDPGVIVEGSTFNDVTVARVTSPYIWLTRPITNAFTTAATFFTGVQMFSTSTNDVHWQALQFVPPTFLKELDYLNQQRVGGSNVQAALTIQGGHSGTAGLVMERTGIGTNEWTFSGEQVRLRDRADSRYLASWLKSGGTLYQGWGNSSAVLGLTPLNVVAQGEAASGTNLSGGSVTIRSGTGTGSAVSAQVNIAAPIPGSSGTTVQTYGTGLRIQFPATPDATVNNSPLQSLRYDGTNWQFMTMSWTNESGLWRQYWR